MKEHTESSLFYYEYKLEDGTEFDDLKVCINLKREEGEVIPVKERARMCLGASGFGVEMEGDCK